MRDADGVLCNAGGGTFRISGATLDSVAERAAAGKARPDGGGAAVKDPHARGGGMEDDAAVTRRVRDADERVNREPGVEGEFRSRCDRARAKEPHAVSGATRVPRGNAAIRPEIGLSRPRAGPGPGGGRRPRTGRRPPA